MSIKEMFNYIKGKLGIGKTKKLDEPKRADWQDVVNQPMETKVDNVEPKEFVEELKQNVIEETTKLLSDKDIVFQLLEEQGLSEKYKTNERATDEILSVCKDVVKNKLGDVDFSNIGDADIVALRSTMSDLVTKDGTFRAIVDEYSREDDFGTPDNPDYRKQVGKKVKSITVPDDKGDFNKITEQLGYISDKGDYSIGTESYETTVETINKDGIVMKKTLSDATREGRAASSDITGVVPRFEGVGSFDSITTMERQGDTIHVTKGDSYNRAAVFTRNDTRYNESDINVPYQAMDIVDAKLSGKDQSQIEQMYENLSPYYKNTDKPEIREAQKKETAERISKDKYAKGLEEYYKKCGYKDSDFSPSLQME